MNTETPITAGMRVERRYTPVRLGLHEQFGVVKAITRDGEYAFVCWDAFGLYLVHVDLLKPAAGSAGSEASA